MPDSVCVRGTYVTEIDLECDGEAMWQEKGPRSCCLWKKKIKSFVKCLLINAKDFYKTK